MTLSATRGRQSLGCYHGLIYIYIYIYNSLNTLSGGKSYLVAPGVAVPPWATERGQGNARAFTRLWLIYIYIYIYIYKHTLTRAYIRLKIFLCHLSLSCSVGWGFRIHQLLLCRVVRPPLLNECPVYDTKQSVGEVPVMLMRWGMRSIPLLPSLPGPLWAGVVAPDRVLSMG